MPKFLTTRNTASHIEEIIIESKEILVLVSPFVFIHPNLVSRLKDAVDRKVNVILVLKDQDDQEINSSEIRKFCKIGLRVLVNKRIHGKAYFNEKEAIITSFNLIESSERNSIEFGVLVTKEEALDVYERIVIECNHLISQSDPLEMSDDGSYFILDTLGSEKLANQKNGFCIGCSASIPFNFDRPFCIDCYRKWDKNMEKQMQYCHFCKKSVSGVSFLSPVCRNCI